MGLDSCIVKFFANYLTDRKTNYVWNNFSSSMFEVNIGVGQGSALSLILFALYLSPFLYILENCLKNLNIPVFIILFVDDGLFISQNMLRSMPLGNNVDLGKGYDDMIGCTTCSLSQRLMQ